MLSASERDAIHLKALEQALRQAGVAKADALEPLLPVLFEDPWVVQLTDWDRDFLKINKIRLS